jgi:hypothetical protein
MHHGIKSLALDGVEYRSDIEKMFVNQFLYQKHEYEYEKPYPTTTKHTCDFYFPLFKLWLEVVPYSDNLFEVEVKEVIPEKIYLNVPYESKMLVKTNHARWDASKKSWYIVSYYLPKYRASDRLKQFLPVFEKITVDNSKNSEYQNFLEYYKNIDMKREIIEKRKEMFCVVTEEDLKCESLLHILQSKGLDGWKFIRAIEHVGIASTTTKIVQKDNTMEVVADIVKFIKNPKNKTVGLSFEQKSEIAKAITEVANYYKIHKPKKKRNNTGTNS